MGVRIFEFSMEGMTEPVKLSTMPWKESKAFVAESKALLAEENVAPARWTDRRDTLVQASFDRAGGEGDVTELFDGAQLSEMQAFIMECSGLRVKKRTGGSDGSLDFDWLEGCLISETHWKPDEIDEMCTGRLMAQFSYWKENPPMHLMIKAALQIESGESAGTAKEKAVSGGNQIATAQAMKMLSGSARAKKLSTASPQDRERFEALKGMANGR